MTAKRNNEGKPRLSLIPRAIQVEMAKVLGFGEGKYSLHNWRGGGKKLTAHYLMDSADRHIVDYLAGEDLDEESGLHNLGHAACNIAFLLELLADGKLIDDRYKPLKSSHLRMIPKGVDLNSVRHYTNGTIEYQMKDIKRKEDGLLRRIYNACFGRG